MNNEHKTYLFSPEERLALCRAAFRGEKGIRVRYSDGMLLDLVKDRPEAVLVKGIRNAADLEYERPMAAWHREKGGCETLYLDANEEFRGVSSTKVRELLAKKGDLTPYLSEKVRKFLANKL